MNTATILVKENIEPDLSLFPYLPGQYMEPGNAENPDGEGILIILNLADRTDFTVAQEQYLNTHDGVLGYNTDQSAEGFDMVENFTLAEWLAGAD